MQLSSSPETLNQSGRARISGIKDAVESVEFNNALFAFGFLTLTIRGPRFKKFGSDPDNVIREDLQEILITGESQG